MAKFGLKPRCFEAAVAIVGFLLCCMIAVQVPGVEALANGAPSLACASMRPYHFTYEPQPVHESPFVVRQSKLHFRPGNDTIKVILTVDHRDPNNEHRWFKGFFVKAFHPITNMAIGQFHEESFVNLRKSCHAATHVNAANKKRVVLHWSSDDRSEGANLVVFEATFVETFRKFYVGVQSTFRSQIARAVVETAFREKQDEVAAHALDNDTHKISQEMPSTTHESKATDSTPVVVVPSKGKQNDPDSAPEEHQTGAPAEHHPKNPVKSFWF